MMPPVPRRDDRGVWGLEVDLRQPHLNLLLQAQVLLYQLACQAAAAEQLVLNFGSGMFAATHGAAGSGSKNENRKAFEHVLSPYMRGFSYDVNDQHTHIAKTIPNITRIEKAENRNADPCFKFYSSRVSFHYDFRKGLRRGASGIGPALGRCCRRRSR